MVRNPILLLRPVQDPLEVCEAGTNEEHLAESDIVASTVITVNTAKDPTTSVISIGAIKSS